MPDVPPPRGSGKVDRLDEDLERYLAAAQTRGVAETTLAIYRRDLSQYTSFLRAAKVTAFWMVDRALVRRWLSGLRAQGLGSGSIARRAKEARAFTRAVLDGYQDPFSDLPLPRVASRRREVLSRVEIARLLAPAGDSAVAIRDRAILALAYATGLRAAELVALDLRQVDLDRGELSRWGDIGQPRPSFLGKVATEALRAYLESARGVMLKGRQERALFVSREAGRLSVRALEHLVTRRAQAIGLEASPNDLRLACAAHLREGGASALAVRGLLSPGMAVPPRPTRRP